MHEPCGLVLDLIDADEKVGDLTGWIGGDPVGERGEEPDCHGINVTFELVAA